MSQRREQVYEKLDQGGEQERGSVGQGGELQLGLLLLLPSVWVCVTCECDLVHPFRSHGSTGAYLHPTSCDLCPIPTGHPHWATDAYSLAK